MLDAPSVTLDGILLLYHHSLQADAPTIMEHVDSFGRYSRHPCLKVNTFLGFPVALEATGFRVIVLHYSLFGTGTFLLDDRFMDYLKRKSPRLMIAFFQDDYQHCRQRFDLIDRLGIDWVYTLLAPEYHQRIYHRHCRAKVVRQTLAGYISEDLLATAASLRIPDPDRYLDIGYRARECSIRLGKQAREKYEIAIRFRPAAERHRLTIDIETDEDRRIYGDAWYRFLANCRGTLGAESGVSIFDLDGEVQRIYDRLQQQRPGLTDDQIHDLVLQPFEGNISYRVISPRVFEAAALRVCLVLVEGRYNGLIEPYRHYLPIRKDYSNLDEVIEQFLDPAIRQRLTDNAYSDLVESGSWTYRSFIAGLDREFESAGILPRVDARQAQAWRELQARCDAHAARARLPHDQVRATHEISLSLRNVLQRFGLDRLRGYRLLHALRLHRPVLKAIAWLTTLVKFLRWGPPSVSP